MSLPRRAIRTNSFLDRFCRPTGLATNDRDYAARRPQKSASLKPLEYSSRTRIESCSLFRSVRGANQVAAVLLHHDILNSPFDFSTHRRSSRPTDPISSLRPSPAAPGEMEHKRHLTTAPRPDPCCRGLDEKVQNALAHGCARFQCDPSERLRANETRDGVVDSPV